MSILEVAHCVQFEIHLGELQEADHQKAPLLARPRLSNWHKLVKQEIEPISEVLLYNHLVVFALTDLSQSPTLTNQNLADL